MSTAQPAHAFVADISRSLEFYRGLGCEVRLVADGWLRLDHGDAVLVLERAGGRVRSATTPLVRLACEDVRTLRTRLLARGIGTRWTRPTGGPVREFEVVDPDGHRIVVSESRVETTPRSAGSGYCAS